MKRTNEENKRLLSEQMCMKRITNDDLVCKDCKHKFDDSKKYGNTSKCEAYELKPGSIIVGGDCEYYKPE